MSPLLGLTALLSTSVSAAGAADEVVAGDAAADDDFGE